MKFKKELVHGNLIRRYKRFLADVMLDNGNTVVAHCTNSGSMKSCIEVGAEVYLSEADDPKRKTRFTWEMIKINGSWIGVNTLHPNLLVFEAIRDQRLEGLTGYRDVKREVTWGDSRFDIMAQNENETCFVEVKNVTMKVGDYARFPDAVSTRGRKHLETLIKVKETGMRAAMVYVVQRSDVKLFSTADDIDPTYAEALRRAISLGVEIFVIRANVQPSSIVLTEKLPVHTSLFDCLK